MSGDEAGRDGVWLHRFCVRQGIENSVVDAASIEVNRRSRRAQTERLEVHKRLTMQRRRGDSQLHANRTTQYSAKEGPKKRTCGI